MEKAAAKLLWRDDDGVEVQLRRHVAEEIVAQGGSISGTAAGNLLATFPLWAKWRGAAKGGAKRTVAELLAGDGRFCTIPGSSKAEKLIALKDSDVVSCAFRTLHAAAGIAWWGRG